MKHIGVGIIGIGNIGRAHLEAVRRLGYAEIRGISVRDESRGRAICEDFAIARLHTDYRGLLADPSIEVVHNCTPNPEHFRINRDIMAAGKHIISEKPLTLDSSQSLVLRDLANASGLVHAVNFVYRHHALVQHLRGMIEAGELGAIHSVSGSYLQDWLLYEGDYNWRIEAGLGGPSRAMADIGSHWIDLAQFLLGRNVAEVCADFATIHPRRARPASGQGAKAAMIEVDTEDYAAVLLRFEGGARGSLAVSQVSAGNKLGLWIQVDGSKASARWEQERAHELWIGHRDAPNERLVSHPGLLNTRGKACASVEAGRVERWPEAQKSMVNSVYQTILESASPSFADFAAAHRVQLVIDACLASERGRAWKMVGG